MLSNVGAEPTTVCCICGSPESAFIQFDRPVILLCECDACGKFIIKQGTLHALLHEPDFEQCRNRVSSLIRKFFEKHKYPLEIILNGETPRTRHTMTVARLMNDARGGGR